jgi:hypothetical protein
MRSGRWSAMCSNTRLPSGSRKRCGGEPGPHDRGAKDRAWYPGGGVLPSAGSVAGMVSQVAQGRSVATAETTGGALASNSTAADRPALGPRSWRRRDQPVAHPCSMVTMLRNARSIRPTDRVVARPRHHPAVKERAVQELRQRHRGHHVHLVHVGEGGHLHLRDDHAVDHVRVGHACERV